MSRASSASVIAPAAPMSAEQQELEKQQELLSQQALAKYKDTLENISRPLDPRIKDILHGKEGGALDEKGVQFEIESLLGKATSWSSESSEVKGFREFFASSRRRMKEKGSGSAAGGLVLPPVYLAAEPTPAGMAKDFLVKVHLPNEEMWKKLKFNCEDTVLSQLMKIHTKFKLTTPSFTKPPEQFMFKVTGKSEYLHGDHKLSDFEYFRTCIVKKIDPEVNLVEIDSVARAATHEESATKDIYDEEGDEADTNELDHANLSVDSSSWHSMRSISLWDLRRKFRVRICGVDNVLIKFRPEERGMDPNDLVLYVTASLCYGGEYMHSVPLFTRAVPYQRSARLWEWVETEDILLAHLPRETRICFAVFVRSAAREDSQAPKRLVQTPRDEAVGWVNVQLINHLGHFRQGKMTMKMWPDEKANPIGTCMENLGGENVPLLTVEFDSYALPVVYPSGTPPPALNVPSPRKYESSPFAVHLERIQQIVSQDPLYELQEEERQLLWSFRDKIKDMPRALPKFLCAVNWHNPADVVIAQKLLKEWAPLPPLDALELLDAKHADSHVRQYALKRLEELSDAELMEFVLQIVQVLKYEPYHNSPVSRFLLRRAVRCPHIIGHIMFWHLKGEMHVPTVRERHGLILEEYLTVCGTNYRRDLMRQNSLMEQLLYVALQIKQTPKEKRRTALFEYLGRIEIPARFKLPYNPRLEASGIIIDKCKVMDSKKLPLWIVFKNADPTGDPIRAIFKAGDDLRQDQLTLQMIRIMDKLWKQQGFDLHLIPYACISTGDEVGMVEVVMNSDTIASITRSFGGATAALGNGALRNWLQGHNPKDSFLKAQDKFALSCAGYCVATYVLGIGDRHNDNIMLTNSGNLFHIDFGHFLGNFKKFAGMIERETSPFRFTPMYAEVLGGTDGPFFEKFKTTGCKAFNILRKNGNILMSLFLLMLSTGIPELRTVEDIKYLQKCLILDKTDEEGVSHFVDLIKISLENKRARLDDMIHIMAH